jgi:beta-N-acetylhexosaminidase
MRLSFQMSPKLLACRAIRAVATIACACLSFFVMCPTSDAAPSKRGKAVPHTTSKARLHGLKNRISKPQELKNNIKLAAQQPANGVQELPGSGTAVEPAQTPLQILTRDEILATDVARLERLGRHIMIGFHRWDDVKALVEKRAIGGIFITDHNVRNRTAAAIKAEIAELQSIRDNQGLPPLIIAADQEGGSVSRLSPPLKRQMSLGRLLKDLPHDEERRKAVVAYADTQAIELKKLGVTLNFAPVVDLKLDPTRRDDGETRLRLRAISNDPYLVAKVAGWYCDAVAVHGLMCTLKHFPGLGRVARDTHVASEEIAASEGQLELNDWVPFRRVMAKSNAAMMLGHVRVRAIDRANPASHSKAIITDLVRKRWQYDGLLITDDFSMGAIAKSKVGVGTAAVHALDAGADVILISFSEKHLNTVFSALLAADADNQIDRAQAAVSVERISRLISAATASRAQATAD